MGRNCITLLLPLALFAGACDIDPFGNDDDDDNGGEPVTLAIVGHGAVAERFSAEVAAAGDWAYTSTWNFRFGTTPGNAVKIWDVSSATPQLADSLVIGNATTLGDIQISDDGALLAVATEGLVSGSMVVFDRSNPARPVELSRHTTDNTRRGVHTLKLGRVNGTLYAFLSINPPSAQLVIVSLADPANPQEVAVLPMGEPYIHDVFVRDGLLFTAEWDDGMSIRDIGCGGRGGSPANPVLIGNVRTVGGNVHNMWWFHDPRNGEKRYVFVGEEAGGALGATSAGDIHVVDVSDLANPREVAFYTVPDAGTHNFTMDEASGILYAAYYSGGVRALDVRGDLSDCTAEQRDPVTDRCNLVLMGREAGTALTEGDRVSVWGVARVGNALFATDMASGLYRLDITPLIR